MIYQIYALIANDFFKVDASSFEAWNKTVQSSLVSEHMSQSDAHT